MPSGIAGRSRALKGIAETGKFFPCPKDVALVATRGDWQGMWSWRRRSEVRHQVVFSHSLNARGRSIASGETEVVSPAKHKRDNTEAIFS
jgi:hypothetical protein